MDDKQLAALIKKNAAKADKLSKARNNPKRFDPTLPPPPDEDADTSVERDRFFKEMKKREF